MNYNNSDSTLYVSANLMKYFFISYCFSRTILVVITSFSLESTTPDNLLFNTLVKFFLIGVQVFMCWKISIHYASGNKKYGPYNINKVMKNLLIFSIIFFIIKSFVLFIFVQITFNNLTYEISTNPQIMQIEKSLTNSNEIREYQTVKHDMIEEVKIIYIKYFIISEIFLFIICVLMVPLHKNSILNNFNSTY